MVREVSITLLDSSGGLGLQAWNVKHPVIPKRLHRSPNRHTVIRFRLVDMALPNVVAVVSDGRFFTTVEVSKRVLFDTLSISVGWLGEALTVREQPLLPT